MVGCAGVGLQETMASVKARRPSRDKVLNASLWQQEVRSYAAAEPSLLSAAVIAIEEHAPMRTSPSLHLSADSDQGHWRAHTRPRINEC